MKYTSLIFVLKNAIINWHNDNKKKYRGLDDELFISHVCKETGLSRKEYMSIVCEGNTENECYLILSNNSECDDLSVYAVNGTKREAYKYMQALVLKVATDTTDNYTTINTDSSDMTACIQRADSHSDFRVVSLRKVTDITDVDGITDTNIDAIPDDICWDNEDVLYALHDVGREEEILEVRATNIKWDTHELDKSDLVNQLPNTVIIREEFSKPSLSLVDVISDYLSDEYGFCHEGFDIVYLTEAELNAEMETLKRAIYDAGINAIEDFLGHPLNNEKIDIWDEMDNVLIHLPDEEYLNYLKKYCNKYSN